MTAARQIPFASGPLWPAMLRFLVPMMGSNVLQALSGTVTSIYLGRMLGVSALAAVSAFFPFLFFMISFVIGVSNGATVLIGQAHGARDAEKVRAVAGTTVGVVTVLAVVVGSLGAYFADAVLLAAGTPADVLPRSEAYARVSFVSLPVLFVFLAYTTFLRGTGDARTPLRALVLATAVSLALTPALIRGWLGLPQLDVRSGAVAALAGYVVALAWLLWHLKRRKSPLAADRALLAHLRPDWKLIRLLLRIGLPTGVQLVMVSLSEIAVLSFVNAFGSTATAAYGAVNQVVSYVQFPAISIGITASIFGAQAIGAGHADRLRAIARTAIGLVFVLVGMLIALVYLFSREILGWFITDAATLEIAHRLMSITLWSYLIFGSSAVLAAVMRSSGTVLWPTTFSIASIWIIEVPVAWLLSRRLGLDGIWIAYPIAFACSLAMQATFFVAVWARRTHVRLV